MVGRGNECLLISFRRLFGGLKLMLKTRTNALRNGNPKAEIRFLQSVGDQGVFVRQTTLSSLFGLYKSHVVALAFPFLEIFF